MNIDCDIPKRVSHLHALCQQKHPNAAQLRARDAFAALSAVPEITVQRIINPNAANDCPVDGRYHAINGQHVIEIYRRNDARDRFTAMHEFGHYLISYDEEWHYDIRPRLGKNARRTEESIVNIFAAESLIPHELVLAHLGTHVSASGVRNLYLETQASVSACLTRALSLPGERCIMLTDINGVTYFTDSTGEPFAPGRNVPQPAVARAISTAWDAPNRSATLTGAEGIVYRSGKTNPYVTFDVALINDLAIVIATPTPYDTRLRSGYETVAHSCNNCGEDFAPDHANAHCEKCREPKCPRCRKCACAAPPPICPQCFTTLSVADVAAGREQHEDC